MLKVIFSEEEHKLFYPFNILKSFLDVKIGILSIRQYYSLLLYKYFSQHKKYKDKETWYIHINTRWIATIEEIDTILSNKSPMIMYQNKIILASITNQKNKKNDENKITKKHISNTLIISSLYDYITYGEKIFSYQLKVIKKNKKKERKSYPNNTIIGKSELITTEDNVSLNNVSLNTKKGGIYIDKGAEIMEGSCIRGPVYIGENSVVKMNTNIYGCVSIGKYSIVGGEIKNSIIGDYSAKGHEGYMGDSIVGDWVNIGAGTITSNMKNTGSLIPLWNSSSSQDTNSMKQKLGVIIGSFTKIGIGHKIFSGCSIGIGCNITDNRDIKGDIPHFTWNNEKYNLKKLIIHTKNWFELKKVKFDDSLPILLKKLYSSLEPK